MLKQTASFIVITVISLFVLAGPAMTDDAEFVQASVTPSQANLGDEVVYTVEVMTGGAQQISPDIILPDFAGQFQLGEVFSSSKITLLNGRTYIRNTKEAHLIVKAKGVLTIPSARVEIINPATRQHDTKDSNPVTLSVNESTGTAALPTPTPAIAVLRPIKESAHVSVGQWLPFAIGAAVLALILGGMYYVRHRPAPAPAKPAEPVDQRTPEQRALDELEKAMVLKGDGKINEFYTALSAILRRFMAESYHFKAEEATSREMLAAMESMKFKPEFLDRIRQYLQESDKVKFANIKPASERIEAILPETVELIKASEKIVIETPPPPPETVNGEPVMVAENAPEAAASDRPKESGTH